MSSGGRQDRLAGCPCPGNRGETIGGGEGGCNICLIVQSGGGQRVIINPNLPTWSEPNQFRSIQHLRKYS